MTKGCYGHCGRQAKAGQRFCSQRCAARWAEAAAVAGLSVDEWCETCGDYVGIESSNHGLLQCSHSNPVHLRQMGEPHPEQAAIDAAGAEMLRRKEGA